MATRRHFHRLTAGDVIRIDAVHRDDAHHRGAAHLFDDCHAKVVDDRHVGGDALRVAMLSGPQRDEHRTFADVSWTLIYRAHRHGRWYVNPGVQPVADDTRVDVEYDGGDRAYGVLAGRGRDADGVPAVRLAYSWSPQSNIARYRVPLYRQGWRVHDGSADNPVPGQYVRVVTPVACAPPTRGETVGASRDVRWRWMQGRTAPHGGDVEYYLVEHGPDSDSRPGGGGRPVADDDEPLSGSRASTRDTRVGDVIHVIGFGPYSAHERNTASNALAGQRAVVTQLGVSGPHALGFRMLTGERAGQSVFSTDVVWRVVNRNDAIRDAVGTAEHDIRTGDLVVIDAETGRLRPYHSG